MQALTGLKVLDMSRTLAGPFCTMLLGDQGADVIKVEEPGRGDESRRFTPPTWNSESCYYLSSNRNKRSITLNLKASEGKEMFLEMVKQADVVISNYRPGVMERIGLGYDVLSAVNEKIKSYI